MAEQYGSQRSESDRYGRQDAYRNQRRQASSRSDAYRGGMRERASSQKRSHNYRSWDEEMYVRQNGATNAARAWESGARVRRSDMPADYTTREAGEYRQGYRPSRSGDSEARRQQDSRRREWEAQRRQRQIEAARSYRAAELDARRRSDSYRQTRDAELRQREQRPLSSRDPSRAARPYSDSYAGGSSYRETAYNRYSREAGYGERTRGRDSAYNAPRYRSSASDERARSRSGASGDRARAGASASSERSQARSGASGERTRSRSSASADRSQTRASSYESRAESRRGVGDAQADSRLAQVGSLLMVPVVRVQEFAGSLVGRLRGGRQIYASGGRGGFDIADFFQASKMVVLGIAALLIVALVFFTAYSCSPTTFHVNGQEVSAIRATTYQGLIDQGFLETKKGNLTAVDGEVLEEGAGKDPTVFLDGEQVELGARASETGEITAQDGEDEIEPYTATQQITPKTTKVARGSSSGDYTGDFNFYMGVLHVVTDPGQEGITETRTGETTGKTATVEVQEMKPRLFENLDALLPADKKLVALTFDDGPNPVEGGTNEILAALAKYNVKGTFFMLGTQAEEFPDLAKKVADAGHQVASHSYSHDEEHYLNQTTMDDVRTQISKGREAVKQASGQDPAYMRPPGGNISEEAIVAAEDLTDGYIGWSIDTLDYTLPGSDVIASTVLDEIAPGAVILMHDGGGDRTETAEALDEIIPKLQSQGYTFVTVNELVQAILAERGDTAQNASASSQDGAQTQDGAQDAGAQDATQDGTQDANAQDANAEEGGELSA